METTTNKQPTCRQLCIDFDDAGTGQSCPTDIESVYRYSKEKHPDAILLFRHSDRYALYNDDALKVGKFLGLAVTIRADINMAEFPANELDKNLPMLIRGGYRVCICEPNKKKSV